MTGGAGFIGSHLCDRLLAEGKRVVALDDLSTGRIANLAEARSYGSRFTFYNLDVGSNALRTVIERHRPEVIMHLAGRSRIRESMQDPVGEARANVMGLLSVLDAAVAAGVRKVVVASSGGAIYGEAKAFPVKERARRGSRPTSPHGITKKIAEDYLELYRETRGLDYTLLAPSNVYGPRQRGDAEGGVVAVFAQRLLSKEPPTIYDDGNQTRDFVFVDDTVHAFSLAATEGGGAMLNVGTGIETSVNRVFQMLAVLLRYHGQPRFVAGPPGDVRRMALDYEMAERVLGWRPWTHLEDGLAETVAYLRDQRRAG